MRHALTLMEALLAVVLALTTVFMLATLSRGIGRLSHSTDLAGTLSEGTLALATITRDLTQAVQKPDPAVEGAVLAGPGYFQLIRAEFEPDGKITGSLVLYQRQDSPGGNFRMRRKTPFGERLLPGLYRNIRFASLKGRGGPFVRVTLRLTTHDTKADPGRSAEEAVLSSLVRVMGPERIGTKGYRFDFMETLNSIEFFKGP